jgi:telomerase reverse transcriptase
MKYIFPREFGLHNVFESAVNSKETVQPFQDYTMREQEIKKSKHIKALKNRGGLDDHRASKDIIPKRLRGKALEMVSRFQKRHSQCPYAELLRYYCVSPAVTQRYHRSESHTESTRLQGGDGQRGMGLHMEDSSRDGSTSLATRESVSRCETTVVCSDQPHANLRENESIPQRQSFADFATPPVKVSAFCRSVLSNIIPDEFWGFGEDGDWNKRSMMRNVDRFINLRKFESLSLHEVLQGLKVFRLIVKLRVYLILATDYLNSLAYTTTPQPSIEDIHLGLSQAAEDIFRVCVLCLRFPARSPHPQ